MERRFSIFGRFAHDPLKGQHWPSRKRGLWYSFFYALRWTIFESPSIRKGIVSIVLTQSIVLQGLGKPALAGGAITRHWVVPCLEPSPNLLKQGRAWYNCLAHWVIADLPRTFFCPWTLLNACNPEMTAAAVLPVVVKNVQDTHCEKPCQNRAVACCGNFFFTSSSRANDSTRCELLYRDLTWR